ncbi:MAG: hypothetical protein AB7S38_40460 [Vulcanimicrobiota bacterium]
MGAAPVQLQPNPVVAPVRRGSAPATQPASDLPQDRVTLGEQREEDPAARLRAFATQMRQNGQGAGPDKPDPATQAARDRAIADVRRRTHDDREVRVNPEDFTREKAEQTLRDQQQFVQDLKSGKKLDSTDGDALPFATIYAEITEDMLKKAEGRPEDEQKMIYGIINTFHKYYDPAHAKDANDMDGVWKSASDQGFDVSPGITDEVSGFMHSLRAHVVSDLDRAMAQVLNEGVKEGHFRESDLSGKWKNFFNGELKDVFVDAQSTHRGAVHETLKGSPFRTIAGWFGAVDGRESEATKTILSWRADAYDRALNLLKNQDADAFVRDHDQALRTTNETVEQNFLDAF